MPAQPQTSSAPPIPDTTFRAGAQEVLVDATVVDRKGNFQRDLTAQGFKLWEDGKEQKITSFSLESAEVPRRSHAHFIALVFEAEDDPGLRQQAMQFVDRFAAPDRYLAVFSKENGQMQLRQVFTTDTGRVKDALRSMPAIKAPGGDEKTRPRKPLLDLLGDRIDSVAAALAPIHGRKALILFTYGFFSHRGPGTPVRDDPWLQTIDNCNRAGVSVYSFINKSGDAGGGDYYSRPIFPEDDRGGSTDRIRDLAERTGGRYTPPGTYDLAAYLGGISKEQNDYYLLGYAPSAGSEDKPCHKIKVKVDRDGLDVRARDSYCTSGEPMRTLKPAERALEPLLTSGAPGNIAAGLQLSWFYSKPNEAVVDIALDLDPRVIKMHGKQHGEFNLLGIAFREDGSIAQRVGDTVKLDFQTTAEADGFVKSPYHYSRQFRLAPGQYRFRIAAGSGAAPFAAAEKALLIDPWGGKTLSASGIAFSTHDSRVTDLAAELDSSLVDGPHRLVSNGRATAPMGGVEFKAGQSGMFYFEVYQPLTSDKPPAIRMRVLDRSTGDEQVDSGPMDAGVWMKRGNPVIPIALTLPVSNLPGGSYTLEVRVTDNGDGSVVRRADFDVK